MTINRNNPITSADSSIYNDYQIKEGSSNSLNQDNYIRRNQEDFNDLQNYNTYSWTKPYQIPLTAVKNRVSSVNSEINEVLLNYETALKNVYLNPYTDPGIEESHFHIWDELYKNNKTLVHEYFPESNVEEKISDAVHAGGSQYFDETTGQYIDAKELHRHFSDKPAPDYIPFEQYLYAEEHGCRGCRKFVKDYDRIISHSSFVHLFDFRYFLKLLSHESKCIKESLANDFGVEYEDESQKQTASFYFSWAEMASHYTKLIAQQFVQEQDSIPASEVDNISKKQAAQFQAFFSIRVASYTEAVDNLLFSVKKDLVDTCEIFYKRFVSPAIRFKSHVAAPLELDIQTTQLKIDAPMLAEEVITAVNAFKGNFGSVLADMVQRRNNLKSKFDRLLSLNIQRRKYVSYIDQLSVKASSRRKIIVDVTEDKYSSIFDRIIIDKSERETLKSSHINLDGLEEDHHPQYLMRAGGTIFGDIEVVDGIRIDGVDLSEHGHTGLDGSVKIKSTDIDYDSARDETTVLNAVESGILEVSINSFQPDIRTGGTPVVDVILDISIPDEVKDKYEFEVIYVEN